MADVELIGVDLDAFALLRALAPLGAPASSEGASAVVAVAVGAERSTIAVSNGLICEFTRVLEWGGRTMTDELVGQLSVSAEDAEKLKIAVGLTGEPTDPSIEAEQAARVRESLNETAATFARELVASLQFYQSQTDSLGIGEILLAGGSARLAGFAETLSQMVGVTVRVGDPFANLGAARKGEVFERDPALAIAIGLGLGQ